MMQQLWGRLQSWCDNTLRQTAVKRLSSTVDGQAVKNSIPPVFAFCVAAALFIAQLSMLRWPESFSAFLVASPAVAVVLLTGLVMCAYPRVARHVPTYAIGTYSMLTAVQCIFGAFAMLLPFDTASMGYRLLFAIITTLTVLLSTYGCSQVLVEHTVQNMSARQKRETPEPEMESAISDSDSELRV